MPLGQGERVNVTRNARKWLAAEPEFRDHAAIFEREPWDVLVRVPFAYRERARGTVVLYLPPGAVPDDDGRNGDCGEYATGRIVPVAGYRRRRFRNLGNGSKHRDKRGLARCRSAGAKLGNFLLQQRQIAPAA